MTISIKPTATETIIQQNGSDVLAFDNNGTVEPRQKLYPAVPAFSASSATNTTFVANVFKKIIFDVEDFDTTSAYDVSNSRFTPQVSGYYQVNLSYKLETVTHRAVLAIYKNGIEEIGEGWYENGQLQYKGNLKDGKTQGLWKMYHENGQLKEEIQKYNYEEISKKCWDQNGKKILCK